MIMFSGILKGTVAMWLPARADVTLENLTHSMLNEPELDKTRDELAKRYENRGESYPYAGFIVGHEANRLMLKNCLLTAHTAYYEDKPAPASLASGSVRIARRELATVTFIPMTSALGFMRNVSIGRS